MFVPDYVRLRELERVFQRIQCMSSAPMNNTNVDDNLVIPDIVSSFSFLRHMLLLRPLNNSKSY